MEDLVGAAVFQMDIDGGIALEEFLQVGRQIVQPNAVNSGDADCARDDVFNFLQTVVERVMGLDDLLAVFVEAPGLRG